MDTLIESGTDSAQDILAEKRDRSRIVWLLNVVNSMTPQEKSELRVALELDDDEPVEVGARRARQYGTPRRVVAQPEMADIMGAH